MVSTDEVDIAVYDTGPGGGRAVLLAHGMTWDHRELAEVASILHRGGLRVASFDARGVGRSTRHLPDPAAHSVGRMAADCAAVIDHLGGPPPVVGGASMGAAVTLHAAASLPAGTVAGLLQLAPGVGASGVAPDTAGYLEWLAAAVRAGGWPGLVEAILASDQDPGDIAEQLALAEDWSERFEPDTFVAQITGFPASVAGAGLPDAPDGLWADVPSLVVGWPDDDFHPLGLAVDVAEHVHGALITIDRPSTPDLPARSVAEQVERFVRSLG